MGKYELRPDEAEAVAAVLNAIAVHPTSGIVGVIHGNDRFVATKHGVDRSKLSSLDTAAAKLGAAPITRAK